MKQITLNLTDQEFRELMLLYNLGYLVKDSITQKPLQQIMNEMEFCQHLLKQGHDAGSGYTVCHKVEDGQGIHGLDTEEEMLELFEGFKEYIRSGEDAVLDEAIR